MGHGGQDERLEITLGEKKGRVVSWAICHHVAWSKCLIFKVLLDF